jgi:hypothetical protein
LGPKYKPYIPACNAWQASMTHLPFESQKRPPQLAIFHMSLHVIVKIYPAILRLFSSYANGIPLWRAYVEGHQIVFFNVFD